MDQLDEILFKKVSENKFKSIPQTVEEGGDIYARNAEGKTLLMCLNTLFEEKIDGKAILISADETASVLLQLGADIYSTDFKNRSALFYSVLSLDKPVVSTMLFFKAHINERDVQGKTPLRVLMEKAESYGSQKEKFVKEMTLFLLKHKANPFSKAKDGLTPMDVASKELKEIMTDFVRAQQKNSFLSWQILGKLSRFIPFKKKRENEGVKMKNLSQTNEGHE